MQEVVEIRDARPRDPARRLAAPASLAISAGERVAVFGPNGGGKSLLADMLRGALPLTGAPPRYGFPPDDGRMLAEKIAYVSFRDAYGGNRPAYYQQRWNQWDGGDCPTVGELLGEAGRGVPVPGLSSLLPRRVIELSTGELRRFQLARVLVRRPRLLIVDNPFIGLDALARSQFSSLLAALPSSVTLVMLVSRRADIPSFATHVVTVEDGRVGPKLPRAAFEAAAPAGRTSAPLTAAAAARIGTLAARGERLAGEEVIACRDIRICYGGRSVLNVPDWKVRCGERWALTGPNGSGKSTLLSLICADNPAAYACDIRLFGARRGRGESIWDVKRRIGYVSPELYTTYNRNLPAVDIVASGLYDTIGLFRRPSEAERDLCREWMALFGAEGWASKPYTRLSGGEQRLILLVRAFVKSPPLLILDEPFHGLDDGRLSLARALLDAYARSEGKTLVMVSHDATELPACIDRHLILTKP